MHQTLFTIQALVPVRASASDASEMVSQLLFGDLVYLLARDRQWLHIEVEADGYQGWIDEKAVLPVDQAWLSTVEAWTLVQDDHFKAMVTRQGTSLPLHLSLGCRIPLLKAAGALRIADWELQVPADLVLQVPRKGSGEELVEISERYLGVPYLWGGKGIFGIDCSGLTQMTFALAGQKLPRDAAQQVAMGREVHFEGRQAGDLAFFQNTAGKVHHVGIILPDGNIRHASGHVHDATLSSQGIIGKYTGNQTHTLCSIRRIV
jgi:gamma-D-glutamyl-L-lysine dipeptidyl-peptidase